MLNRNYQRVILSIFTCFLITISLTSCNWYKCKASGKILYDPIEKILNYYLDHLQEIIDKDTVAKLLEQDKIFDIKSESWTINKLESELIVQQVIDKIGLTDKSKNSLSPKKFRRNLEIKIIEGTDVIDISYKDYEQKMAAKIVNTFIETYFQEKERMLRLEAISVKENIKQYEQEVDRTKKLMKESKAEERKRLVEKYKQEIRYYAQMIEANKLILNHINYDISKKNTNKKRNSMYHDRYDSVEIIEIANPNLSCPMFGYFK